MRTSPPPSATTGRDSAPRRGCSDPSGAISQPCSGRCSWREALETVWGDALGHSRSLSRLRVEPPAHGRALPRSAGFRSSAAGMSLITEDVPSQKTCPPPSASSDALPAQQEHAQTDRGQHRRSPRRPTASCGRRRPPHQGDERSGRRLDEQIASSAPALRRYGQLRCCCLPSPGASMPSWRPPSF